MVLYILIASFFIAAICLAAFFHDETAERLAILDIEAEWRQRIESEEDDLRRAIMRKYADEIHCASTYDEAVELDKKGRKKLTQYV